MKEERLKALFRSGSVPVVVILFSIIGPSGRLVGPVARPVIGPVSRPGRRSERSAKDRTGHTGGNRSIVVVPSLNVVALGLVVCVMAVGMAPTGAGIRRATEGCRGQESYADRHQKLFHCHTPELNLTPMVRERGR